MRNGPQIHRNANTTRFTGRTAPLRRTRRRSEPAGLLAFTRALAGASDSKTMGSWLLRLDAVLPLSLRSFLTDYFGSRSAANGNHRERSTRVCDDTVVRELARAIRRFSTERSRELRSECCVRIDAFIDELLHAPTHERHAILCLQCCSIAAGKHAPSRHSEPACIAVELNYRMRPGAAPGRAKALVPEGIRCAIEDFRRERAAAGLPHFDLDCYVLNRQIIFTWRPISDALRVSDGSAETGKERAGVFARPANARPSAEIAGR